GPQMTVEAPSLASTTEVTFPVTGMTCASCVRRVEKALGKVEGVQEASVNLATERAKVVFDPTVASVDGMRTAVEKAGYAIGEKPAALPPTTGQSVETPTSAKDAHDLVLQRELDELKRRWTLSLAAGLVMMTLMYLPLNVPMDVLAPVLLIVATVIQFWAGAPIYTAAVAAAR